MFYIFVPLCISIPKLYFPALSKELHISCLQKQHVPLNRGAFILWNIAPALSAEWMLLAQSLPLCLIYLLSCCWDSRGISGMSTISAVIDKFLSSGRGNTHTYTGSHVHTIETQSLARIGCHHRLVSVPHLWMVTRPRGLQRSHSCLTDTRDQFPPAERALEKEEVCFRL